MLAGAEDVFRGCDIYAHLVVVISSGYGDAVHAAAHDGTQNLSAQRNVAVTVFGIYSSTCLAGSSPFSNGTGWALFFSRLAYIHVVAANRSHPAVEPLASLYRMLANQSFDADATAARHRQRRQIVRLGVPVDNVESFNGSATEVSLSRTSRCAAVRQLPPGWTAP